MLKEKITQAQLTKIYLLIMDSEYEFIKAIYNCSGNNDTERSENLSNAIKRASLTKRQASYIIKLLYGRDSNIRHWRDKLVDILTQTRLHINISIRKCGIINICIRMRK